MLNSWLLGLISAKIYFVRSGKFYYMSTTNIYLHLLVVRLLCLPLGLAEYAYQHVLRWQSEQHGRSEHKATSTIGSRDQFPIPGDEVYYLCFYRAHERLLTMRMRWWAVQRMRKPAFWLHEPAYWPVFWLSINRTVLIPADQLTIWLSIEWFINRSERFEIRL